MRLLHTSDLHIGKRVNEFSMIDEQSYILDKIIEVIQSVGPDAFVIAGDVYDKPVPTAEAVMLFDAFLTRLKDLGVRTFVISGNHDSPERLGFASRIIEDGGIHIHGVYEGEVKAFSLHDEYGDLTVYTLPFVKPTHVRRYFPDATVESYTDAVRVALDRSCVDTQGRCVLVTHQFVGGSARCDSEEISVGGTDNVDPDALSGFDYVALGHLHLSQRAGADNIRYSGSPLKYSLSEVDNKKSLSLVEIREKGKVEVTNIPLIPKTDMYAIRGKYDELCSRDFYLDKDFRDAYVHITLTDEDDIPDAVNKLRVIYKNLMSLVYDNTRTRTNARLDVAFDVEEKSPIELFAALFEAQNNRTMTDTERADVLCEIEKIWG